MAQRTLTKKSPELSILESEESQEQTGKASPTLPDVETVGADINVIGAGLSGCPMGSTRVHSTESTCSCLGTKVRVDGPALSCTG